LEDECDFSIQLGMKKSSQLTKWLIFFREVETTNQMKNDEKWRLITRKYMRTPSINGYIYITLYNWKNMIYMGTASIQ
jgi:hypothetical protein